MYCATALNTSDAEPSDYELTKWHGLYVACDIPGAAKKRNLLKLFAVFSATAWNYSVKFYVFT